MMNSLMDSYIIFMLGMIGFLMYNKHMMTMLLMLEFMVLGLLVSISCYINLNNTEWLMLMIMFFLVCESVLGLSCVVFITRSHGKDMMDSMNMLVC